MGRSSGVRAQRSPRVARTGIRAAVTGPTSSELNAVEAHAFALQRLAGNRATTELLRRLGKGPKGDEPLKGSTAVQRGWLSTNAAKLVGIRRATQSVSVSPVAAATDLGRGGFQWDVWFSIPTAAGADGWVIQEVTADAKFTEKSGTKKSEQYHFWEAWELKKGKTTTIYQDLALDTNDDSYYTPARAAGSKGYDKTYGKVKFYEGPLPSDFKTNNPKTVAGILNSSTSSPWYWDGSGTDHNLFCTWDDAVSPATSKVTTNP